MRYFVVAPDGSRYGPADLPTLRRWVAEGRIAPGTMLIEEGTNRGVPAGSITGLFGAEAPSQLQSTRRPESARPGDDGTWDVLWSYICSTLSILCCGLFVIGGFVYAGRAISKGNRGGYAARAVAVIFLFLWLVTSILTVMFFQQVKDWLLPRIGIEGL